MCRWTSRRSRTIPSAALRETGCPNRCQAPGAALQDPVRRCKMMKGKTDGPCESWPAKVRHCVCRCLKGIVPKCSIKPKPVQQVVPPVE